MVACSSYTGKYIKMDEQSFDLRFQAPFTLIASGGTGKFCDIINPDSCDILKTESRGFLKTGSCDIDIDIDIDTDNIKTGSCDMINL